MNHTRRHVTFPLHHRKGRRVSLNISSIAIMVFVPRVVSSLLRSFFRSFLLIEKEWDFGVN